MPHFFWKPTPPDSQSMCGGRGCIPNNRGTVCHPGPAEATNPASYSGHMTRLVQSEWTSRACTGSKRKRQHRSKAILPKGDPENEGNTEKVEQKDQERRLSPYGIIWTLWIKSHLKLAYSQDSKGKNIYAWVHTYIYTLTNTVKPQYGELIQVTKCPIKLKVHYIIKVFLNAS